MKEVTRRSLLLVAAFLIAALGVMPVFARGDAEEEVEYLEVAPGVPRNETLIIDQIFRYENPSNLNLWTPAAANPTRQSIAYETLWFIDQQTGEWINAVASEPPTYNDEYTQMNAKLRSGLYWSDGVEFTADDLVFTVETLKANDGMHWSAELNIWVDRVYKTGDYEVTFDLKKKNPRFHSYFTARYNAVYMMPKHIWEKVDNPLTFTFNPPVVLGSYTFKDQDPQGYWELWEKRPDWERTPLGKTKGEPKPKYVLTIFYGPSEKKVLAMLDHKLDIFMNVVPEAFESLIKKSDTARSWYQEYPWAWQDEFDGRLYAFNPDKYPLYEKDVRWALALALDGVALQTEHLSGVPRICALPQPPTPLHGNYYFEPLEGWLKEFQLEIEPGVYYKPYNPNAYEEVAAWAQAQGYEVKGDPHITFGYGWWKHAPDVAERLLKKHGFSRDSKGKWLKPDGAQWKFKILVTPDEVDCFRLAFGAVEQWGDFGIECEVDGVERQPYYQRCDTGDFEVGSIWWGGVMGASAYADKWPFIQALHSDFWKPTGQAIYNNTMRIKDPKLDYIIDSMAELHPDDPKVLELGQEFIKWYVENMPGIVTVGFKKYVTQDIYYWDNFPTSENPYAQPCFWFQGGRHVLPFLKKLK